MLGSLSWEADILITIAIFWIVGLVLLFLIPRNRKPASATAWLLFMYVIPILGIIFFFLIGSPKLSKRRRAMQSTMNERITKAVAEAQSRDDFDSLLVPLIPSRYEPFNALNTNLGVSPLSVGMRLNSFPSTWVISSALLRRSIARNVLSTKLASSIICLYLCVSSAPITRASTCAGFEYENILKAGVKIYQFNAPILLHSKTMSIDDDIAVIGSSNFDMRSFQLNLEVTLMCYNPK